MTSGESLFLTAALWSSVCAAVLFLLRLAVKNDILRAAAEGFTALFLLTMSISLAARWAVSGHAPMANRYESLASFAWSLGFVYWYVRLRYKEARAGYFLMPLTVLVMLMVATCSPDNLHGLFAGRIFTLIAPYPIGPVTPALDTWMFETHVASAFVGYAFFGASFSGAVLYLVAPGEAERNLERLIFRTAYYGFALFTISMVIGGIWAYLAWGTYWLWKIKEMWSFLIWMYYAGFLHAFYVREFRGRKVAWLSIIGFIVTMFTNLGVGILMKNTHQL